MPIALKDPYTAGALFGIGVLLSAMLWRRFILRRMKRNENQLPTEHQRPRSPVTKDEAMKPDPADHV